MRIQRLFIYPVKSILPVEVSIAEITNEGFRFDRQYLIIKAPQESSDNAVEHLTIKTTYKLGLFQPSIDQDWSTLTIRHTLAEPESAITIPLTPSPLSLLQSKSYKLSIFGTRADGIDVGDGSAKFFSQHLGMSVRLLYISGSGSREIPGIAYVPQLLSPLTVRAGENLQPQKIRFADAAPLLITSSASEEDARSRLPAASQDEDVIIRFRANLHVDVGPQTRPYDEDDWKELTIFSSDGSVEKATIQCIFRTPRCLSLNANLKTGTMAAREQQMYGLLARDRRVNSAFPHKPVFGQYAFAAPLGATLQVGNQVRVTRRSSSNEDAARIS
ncbi:hypothetical protein F4778DRAFT_761910 [Xylariomycetidae sp. FL2044]|nr:hypothetical protein F4778DRAFT_761910 [Xylariomycetidae sp. FL2044]